LQSINKKQSRTWEKSWKKVFQANTAWKNKRADPQTKQILD
jgi:hypothetical protein